MKRNRITSMIRSAKSKDFKGLNPKTLWKTAKYLTKQVTSIPTLTDQNGNIIQDVAEKATLLNNFFQCFNRSIPTLSESDFTNLDLLNSMTALKSDMC